MSERPSIPPKASARERVIAFVQARRLLRPGDRVLVATGGGLRSLGLMQLLAEARDELDLREVAVASVEPMIDEESDAPEVIADVGRLARSLGMDFHAVRPSPQRGGRVDVPAELVQLAREQNFQRIALGNTRDDDAARVLCEFSRGGAEAIRGLAPRVRGGIVRPFLVATDVEAMAFAPSEAAGWGAGISPRTPDEEVVRREILPRLRAQFSDVVMVLQESGRVARARRQSARASRTG